MSGERQLFEETTLRRALRLEPDERPPRADLAAIRRAAAAEAPPRLDLVGALALVGGLALFAAVRVIAVAQLALAAASSAPTPFEAALALLSVSLASIVSPLAQPGTLVAILGVLIAARFIDLIEGRRGRVAA